MNNHLIRILILMLFLQGLHSVLHARELAVTIDDLPLIYEGRYDGSQDEAYYKKIADCLEAFHVRATGFVTGRRVKRDYQRDLLRDFQERGNTIGNHTFNHLDLNEVSAQAYAKDIMLCDALLGPLTEGAKYFRYPYLHRGDSERKRDEVYAFLREHNYVIAPATIFPQDWVFDAQFHDKLKGDDREDAAKIARAYLDFVKGATSQAEKLAKIKVKREIRHILLIHMNVINGYHLRDILSWYRDEGWQFITLDEAVKDAVYSMKERNCSKESETWLERI
jgi:peptidoglycan-N-acetylglucosamine deacetylase